MEYWFWYHYDWLAENQFVPHKGYIETLAFYGALHDVEDNPEIAIDVETQFRAIIYDYILKKMQSIDPTYNAEANFNRPK